MLDSIYSAIDALSVLVPFAIPLAVILGLLIGSFLNVVIYRTPIMMEREWTQFSKEHLGIELTDEEKQPFNLRKPDSRCPKCKSSRSISAVGTPGLCSVLGTVSARNNQQL